MKQLNLVEIFLSLLLFASSSFSGEKLAYTPTKDTNTIELKTNNKPQPLKHTKKVCRIRCAKSLT